MTEAEATRQQRKMVLDEIEPILQEIAELHIEIDNNKADANKKINDLREEEKQIHKQMYSDLNRIQENNDKNFLLILNSYKFRLIQLCKTHLTDGYISSHDFEQLTEMYKLYMGMGGNGQAKEYYDKVMDLEIKD